MSKHSAPTKPEVRSLPIGLWPDADQKAWETACRPRARLQRGGAAAHMKLVVQRDLAKRYGLFLDFVSRSGSVDLTGAAGRLVTPDRVEAYVAELRARVSSVTVYGSIQKLRRMVQLIAPGLDIGWLHEIERDLAADMRPKSKWNRIVEPSELVEAGFSLVAEGEAADRKPKLTQARMVRDGLMVALLACCPVRLRSYAALDLKSSFMCIEGTWWILLSAADTKEKRPDERPVPKFLNEAIESYLNVYRPILARGSDTSRLWLAMNGKPMRQATMADLIPELTLSLVGVRISPHLFRTVAATSAALHAGDNPHFASALLHHHHPTVAQQHYIRASSINAGRALTEVAKKYRGSPKH